MRIYLATKHQKAPLIASELSCLNIEVIECSDFDTDALGTFTGDIERTLTPEKAALVKAQTACELMNAEWGLGSEGSFGGGPYPGIMNWNEEILCLYHRTTKQTVYAKACGPSLIEAINANSLIELERALTKHSKQYWMLAHRDCTYKGLSAEQVIDFCLQNKMTFPLCLTPDLRAMHSPERQMMIRKAAQDLVLRMQSCCPKCNAMNYVIKKAEKGLPCRQCHLPTQRIKSYQKHCDECDWQEILFADNNQADPMYCQLCNP
ncbi:DUF6671 family protein [Pseudoalteromonas sp.]|uniref:DUF6671 family protein n=1 Tax=Pseudoalteromonas sp. TaxID=53249 RepID=UPI0035653221